jgi:AraC-like DNA-binding protein
VGHVTGWCASRPVGSLITELRKRQLDRETAAVIIYPVQHAQQFLVEDDDSWCTGGSPVPFHEPTVRASILAALPDYLTARGVDIGLLLNKAGIPLSALAKPELAISLNSAGLLFELASQRLGDPTFGLAYARAFPPGATGLLGHLMLTAPTVRDVFLVVTRYLQVHTTPMEPQFEIRDGGIGWFSFAWPSTFTEPMLQYTAFSVGSLILRLRRATGPNWLPLAATFQHRAPDDLESYRQMFGSRLKFDQRENSIAVDATTLAMPMPEVLPKLHATVVDSGERLLRDLKRPADMASQLQQQLADRLAAEQPFDLDTVADALGVQPRGLQWRLEQEATTYEQVLLLTRLLQAEHHLRDSDHQLTRIAGLLGFSELSAFTRWCQRQFQMTPSALRRRLRESAGQEPPSPAEDPK